MEVGGDVVREVVAMVWVVLTLLKSWNEAQVVFRVGRLNAL